MGKVPAREKILKAAEHLFNAQGVKAVSADRIIEEAGISKPTFYFYFPQKSNLVGAYLKAQSDAWFVKFDKLQADSKSSSKQKLLKVFDMLEDWIREPDFMGCPFLRGISDPEIMGSPEERVFLEKHFQRTGEIISAWAQEADKKKPEELTKQVLILMAGALSLAQGTKDPKEARTAKGLLSSRFGKLALVLGLALFGAPTLSQARSWSETSKDAITLKLGFVTPSLNSEFKPEEKSQQKVIYQPSSPTKLSIGAGLGPFSVTYGTPGVMSDEEKAKKGESKIDDWQFRFFGDVHTFDLFYQKYSGYYIENTAVVDPSQTGNIIRPDISNESYGIQYFYNFHHDDVSVRAAFDQTTVQTKSGGGGLLVAAANYFKAQADSAILPATVSSQYGRFSTLRGGVFTTFKAGVGGVYTYVVSKWFVSGLLTVAVGPQSQLFDIGTSEFEKTNKFVTGANGKISAGYNSKRFFFALGLFIDTQNIENENLYVTNSTVEGSLWAGARF